MGGGGGSRDHVNGGKLEFSSITFELYFITPMPLLLIFAFWVVPRVLHCTENPIYVFPEMKLRSLLPNSYIYVTVRDLHYPRIGLLFCSQIGKPIL